MSPLMFDNVLPYMLKTVKLVQLSIDPVNAHNLLPYMLK